jgi:tetratricopeptide (TPR) repeat protein
MQFPLPDYHIHMGTAFSKSIIRTAATHLTTTNILLLIAPWDMYGDEFLSCIERHMDSSKKTWIKIDFTEYRGFDEFLQNVGNTLGFTLSDFCELLNGRANHALLFDNIPVNTQLSGKTALEEAISICNMIFDGNPNIKIVLRSRANISNSPLPTVVLQPMDEPDSNRFIMTHPLGNRVSEANLASGEIFRMSSGLPEAINQILEKLPYTRLSDLANESSEMAVKNVDLNKIPASLITSINLLKASSPDDLYPLLQCLAIFPFGEDIVHLRHFQPDNPFYPRQSGQLVNMGLLDAVQHGFFEREDAELPKVVIEVKPAQDYVRSLFADDYQELTNKALALYFGKDWRIGTYKLGPSFGDKKIREFEYSTSNASALLRRVFNDALHAEDPRALQDSLGLLNYYTSKLDKICYYRHICNTCNVLIPKLKKTIKYTGSQDILFRYANSLRMLGDLDVALELYSYLLFTDNQARHRKASILLHIAMIYDEKNEHTNAIKYAKEVKAISEKNSTYHHADSITVCLSKSKHKISKLRNIGRKCLQAEHFTTANNISIRLTKELDSATIKKETYRSIATRSLKENDIFNYVKSTIIFADLALKEGEELSKTSYNALLSCYDFVRSQRLTTLFNSSHNSLWEIIEAADNIPLLGRLFRYSSNIFRLRNDEATEIKFIKKLLDICALNSQILQPEDREYLAQRIENLSLTHKTSPRILGPADIPESQSQISS